MKRFLFSVGLISVAGCTSIPEHAFVDYTPEPGRASPMVRHMDEEEPGIAPVESRAFGLQELLELVDQSPAMAAAQEAIAREMGAVVQGDFMPNPVLRLEVEFMPIDDMGFGNSVNKVKVAQRIETAGKADARVEAALARRDEVQALYFHLRAQAQAEVAKEYYKLIFTGRKVESTARMFELKSELYARAKDLNALGRLSDMDLIAHEVAVEETRVALKTLEAEERRLLRGIEGRLGLASGTITKCTGEVSSWTPPGPGDVQHILLRRNSELVLKDRKVVSAEAALEVEKSRAYPDVTIGLGYARGNEMGDEREDFALGFLEVPFPIVDRNQGGKLSAEASIREAESELVAAAYRVIDDWQSNQERFNILTDKRDLYYDRIIPLLEKDLGLKEKQVEAGRESIQSSLQAALKLEEAVLAALGMDETLTEIMVEMRFLVGGEML
jgi:cobalt-zinc-cadmium efflux system outer membrane protein